MLFRSNLVHDNDTGLLSSSVKLAHSRADVAGGDDVGLAFDSCLDDISVVGVGNERDNEVMLSNGLLESSSVVDIKGNRSGVRKVRAQLFGGLQSTAG